METVASVDQWIEKFWSTLIMYEGQITSKPLSTPVLFLEPIKAFDCFKDSHM